MEEIKFPKYEQVKSDNYVEEQLNLIRDDIEFYELIKMLGNENRPVTTKLVKDNLSKIVDWHDDFKYCKNCPGIDNCAKSTPHMQLSLMFDGVILNRRYDPCDRLLERLEQTTKYQFSDFPEEWRNNLVSTIDKDAQRNQAILKLNKIINGESFGLYLNGSTGIGKSYVAVSFVNTYIRKKKDARAGVIDVLSKFSELQSKDYSFDQSDKEYFNKTMVALSNIDILVLDGLGNEIKTDYVRDRILLPILTERYRNHLPTIITSNYTIEEIAEMYSSGRKNAGTLHPSARHLLDLLKAICGKEITLLSKLY